MSGSENSEKRTLRPAALKALHYAQGQAARAQLRDVLFLMALVLEQLREDALGGFDIGRISPAAEKLLPQISLYLDADGQELANAPDWEIRNRLKEIGPALYEIVDFCNRRTGSRHAGGAFRHAAAFGAAAARYLEMVQDIGRGAQYGGAGDRGKLRRLARLDPFITARFVGEYLQLAAYAVQGTSQERGLLDARARIMGALKFRQPDVLEAGTQEIERIMMMISDAGDALHKAHKALYPQISDQAPHKNVLKHLFQISACYDWKQFERTAAKNTAAEPAPRAKI
jgi:hypothetical protein